MVLSYFKRRRRDNGRTGFALDAGGVAMARVQTSESLPRLTHCRFESGRDAGSLPELVSRVPRGCVAVGVLASGGYHLLLVEAPDVPPEELRAAVRWRIKDLIDFHVDDAVIDVFEMPAPSRGTQGRMMYAVAARAELVRTEIETLEDVGLELEAIDIPELCLRNIAVLLERQGEGVALLYLGGSHGILVLQRQGVMYLTRRMETGVDTLRRANGMRADLLAGLALEVRRSLDYFESHYEQTPVPALYTVGLEDQDRAVIGRELAIDVRDFELADVLDVAAELTPEIARLCLPAIGAALRHDPVRL